MSAESTLTSKGQTTIPQEIRDALQLKSGDRMTYTVLPNGAVLLRVKNKSLLDLGGKLYKKSRKTVPTEQLSR